MSTSSSSLNGSSSSINLDSLHSTNSDTEIGNGSGVSKEVGTGGAAQSEPVLASTEVSKLGATAGNAGGVAEGAAQASTHEDNALLLETNDTDTVELDATELAQIAPDPDEKTLQVREFIQSFDKVTVFVGNTPNYGHQSQATTMITDLMTNISPGTPVQIVTPKGEEQALQQNIQMTLHVPEGVNFDPAEFMGIFGDGAEIALPGDDGTPGSITMPAGATCNATDGTELAGTFSSTTAADQGVGLVRIELSEGDSAIPPFLRYTGQGEANHTFTFDFMQEQPTTTEQKILELAPQLEDQVEFGDVAEYQKNPPDKGLLLTGPVDIGLGPVYDASSSTQVQVKMHPHGFFGDPNADGYNPEKYLNAFIGADRVALPEGIAAGATFPVHVDANAVDDSNLSEQQKKNLNALLDATGTDGHPMLYTYGFHQVPADERQNLLAGMAQGISSESSSQRPILFIAGDRDIPQGQVDEADTVALGDATFTDQLEVDTNRPLVVMAGRLPASVADLVTSKSDLVVAEGKGTIVKAQGLGVPYLITAQGDGLLHTEYHHNADGALTEASNNLYQEPAGTISQYFRGGEDVSSLYPEAGGKNLTVEVLAGVKEIYDQRQN